jgi:hypothetical protein
MRLLLISSMAYILASTPLSEGIQTRMDRLAANTVCMVVNSFYLRDMSMFAVQYGLASGSMDPEALEREVLGPARESTQILDEDRQRVIKELTTLGVDPTGLVQKMQELTTTETVDNVQSWLRVRDARTAGEHLTMIMAKHRVCDAHYKKVRGQPI